ncbi:uncharacterized protein LOC100373635 [Saccoglossus kowalevskii]|uniref:Uncharacterized protein LOC100373635 n=1 Tax=Saccoglossus kowalevskii TaxID=10224 RepID=A0ABM0MRP1_SACKO|nr:PREDICTED: uncharacterized protein LOC100373635 [Saccoglossus kowalevskii]
MGSLREVRESIISEEEPSEAVALLPMKSDQGGPRKRDIELEIEPLYVKEEIDDDYYLKFSPKYKRRHVELVFSDAILLVLDFLQIYCLIFSIALRWTWPEDWSYHTRFLFLFNLDIWEFIKLQLPGVYKPASNYYIPSSEMLIDYRLYLLAWGSLVFLFILSFICIYISINMKKNPNMLVQLARLKRVYITLCQVLALPFGVAICRLFFCTPYVDLLDVHNEITCWTGIHFAYILPFLAIAIVYYIVFPIWMISKIRPHLVSSKAERHEGYIQLKETEYAHSLGTLWLVNLYFLFSSFKRFHVYYRPIIHILKGVLLLWYATLFYEKNFQIGLILVSLLIVFIIICVRRPFRVTSYNFYIIFNFVCLLIVCFLGLLDSFGSIRSAFLTPTYLIWELAGIVGCWVIVTVVWLIYIICRYNGCCCRDDPLWPRMTSHGLDELSDDTRKYMQSLLHGRIVLEYALTTSPLFSPAHELARQIHIINAYSREAELLRDPIHDALWDLLDDLIEAHSKIAPISLFAESVKSSIRQTAGDLMRVMPAFKRRLAQREYDFCLMTPEKRRMLLKMYIIGVFVNDRRDRSRDYQKADVVKKLYNPKKSIVLQTRDVDFDDDDDDVGYYDDDENMYSEDVGLGPTGPRTTYSLYRPDTADSDIVDLMSDEELAEYERRNRPARNDTFSSLDDLNDSIDINAMMAGIPSLTASRSASAASVPNSFSSRLDLGNMISSQDLTTVKDESADVTIDMEPEPERQSQAPQLQEEEAVSMVTETASVMTETASAVTERQTDDGSGKEVKKKKSSANLLPKSKKVSKTTEAATAVTEPQSDNESGKEMKKMKSSDDLLPKKKKKKSSSKKKKGLQKK